MRVFVCDAPCEVEEVVGVGRLLVGLEGRVLYGVGNGVETQRVIDGIGREGIGMGIEEGVGGGARLRRRGPGLRRYAFRHGRAILGVEVIGRHGACQGKGDGDSIARSERSG